MYGQVTEPTVQRKFLKVSKTHTYGGILQDATSLYIPDMLTNVHSKTRCGRINKTYKNEAKCRQLFACSQLGANHMTRFLNTHLFVNFQNPCTRTLPLTPDNDRYWRLVKIILEDVPSKLRQLFQSAFQSRYMIAWGDNSTSGNFFMAMVPKSKKRDKHIVDTVEKGSTANFDCTTLFYSLLFSGIDLLLPVMRKKELRVSPFYESERVDQLREQRNAVAHATTPSISEADFQTKIQEIEDIYTQLQWDQTQLKEAAYGRLWPVEYHRLQGKIDVEKERIDDHEQRLQDLDKRVKNLERQTQQDKEKFVKTVEGMSILLHKIALRLFTLF